MKETSNEVRQQLWSLLGDLPPRERPIQVLASEHEERGSYTMERLVLDLNGIESVPALFVRPRKATGKLPVILFNHSHGGVYEDGKVEMLSGARYLQLPSYAETLTRLGYAALSIDAWGFGERFTRPELTIFKQMLWQGQVMWGMMVYDSVRALDYLTTRADVDPNRIGTLGISMGGTMAWWLAALDERIRFCVDMCSLADYNSLIDLDRLHHHGIYYYVPSLLKHFSTARINALIAPRPHLCLAGRDDPLVPADGLEVIDRKLRQVYADAGVPEHWELRIYEVGHEEPPAMRADIESFLLKWRDR